MYLVLDFHKNLALQLQRLSFRHSGVTQFDGELGRRYISLWFSGETSV